jgi:hypothetical protein
MFIAFSLVFGKGGLLDARDLALYRSYLAANIEDLKEINQNLTLDLKDLSTSPDTLKLFARDYGYYEKNEEVIKIAGAPETKHYYKLGSLLKRNPDSSVPNPVFHIIALGIGFISFTVMLILSRKRNTANPSPA